MSTIAPDKQSKPPVIQESPLIQPLRSAEQSQQPETPSTTHSAIGRLAIATENPNFPSVWRDKAEKLIRADRQWFRFPGRRKREQKANDMLVEWQQLDDIMTSQPTRVDDTAIIQEPQTNIINKRVPAKPEDLKPLPGRERQPNDQFVPPALLEHAPTDDTALLNTVSAPRPPITKEESAALLTAFDNDGARLDRNREDLKDIDAADAARAAQTKK